MSKEAIVLAARYLHSVSRDAVSHVSYFSEHEQKCLNRVDRAADMLFAALGACCVADLTPDVPYLESMDKD